MTRVHHTAICTTDLETSLAFWRDGLGFEQLMDLPFRGDWPTLFDATGDELRAVFLGDPADRNSGIVELVMFPSGMQPPHDTSAPAQGFLLVSLYLDVEAALAKLSDLGLAQDVRRITVHGVTMVTVRDPNGVLVELIDAAAAKQPD
ncbi:MAG TPA: VOC family protein [Mycobacteriales bacterium]|nr:VOC family protein [Mycobacteriales bacterium]